MNLYVWDEFEPDYKDGLAFAIAPDLESAKELVRQSEGWKIYSWGEVKVFPLTEPVAFSVCGGS